MEYLWGVIYRDDGLGDVHVVPVDKDENVLPGHELMRDCRCGVIVRHKNGRSIVLHDEMESV